MERPGRKALFNGTTRTAGSDNGHDSTKITALVSEWASILDAVNAGDYAARISVDGIDDSLQPFAAALNAAIERIAGEYAEKMQMAAIFRDNPLPMLILDRSFAIRDLNEAYEDLMQQSRDRLMSMEASDYRISLLKGDKTDATFTGVKTQSELAISFRDGSTKIVEQYGIPVADDEGGIASAVFVFNDVSREREEADEREKQMKKAQALQQRSESIVQENPMPMILVSTDFKILVTNQAFVDMSGIGKDQILRMNARDFKILEQHGDGLGFVIKQQKRSYGVVTVDLPSGVHVLEQYGIPITTSDGELANILIVYNDITEVKEKEKEVQKLMEEAQQEAARLNASAEDLAGAMARMADGDLTATATIEESDPLARLKHDYNTTLASIKATIEEVSRSSDLVQNTSSEVSKSADEIGRATEQVAVATQQSSEFTRNLLIQIEDINREISDLSASIEEIASTSQEVMARAQKAAAEGNTAAEIGMDAHNKMQAVGEISQQSVDEITHLNEQMHEISNIVKLIGGIAGQTNLLALNAAIEAARAGEHGRGFAVVAGEIRNLAGEAKEASQTIEDLIGTIQTNSDRTAASMKASHTEIRDGIDRVNEAIEALNRIVADIEVAAHGITEITRAAEDQANATTRVMQSMEDSTQMTKENMERIEDMAALAEEVSASTEEVGSASHEMTEMAEQLKAKMAQFTLN
ncbi:MAG: methyl-accepting chemotaxis protein [Methanomicrobiaceae archaeon]|nr:methyl-accepting chemotaxis protein [Methanomicrobiaceae archaeon]